jgi:hypothetical protein
LSTWKIIPRRKSMFLFHRNPKKFLHILQNLGEQNLTATDIVSLPEPLRSVLSSAIRAGKINLKDFAKDLRLSPDGASLLADVLVKKGLFHRRDGNMYDVRASGRTYSHENSRTMELWAKFDQKNDDDKKKS